ncbi:MAG: sodium-dependent transporter [Phycisphaerales bacterium]|nr:sodium-dependent transporter [Phycisphaerales bacterium]
MTGTRAHWGSRLGFILAAAGSAVGLGNIWKFPYITGENGGGWFVLIYLICIALVGLPIMMAEIFIGRTTQLAPVGAFRALSRRGSPWVLTGWLGVVVAFVVLSYYSVVAGWAMHYTWLSITNAFAAHDQAAINELFGNVYVSPTVNLGWHVAFMAITIAIVLGGVQKGLERWVRILMPALFVLMLVMLGRAVTMEGFGRAVEFTFAPNAENLTAAGVLEALGHAFFTLSLGMGAMITYGSYLRRDDDLVATSVTVGVLDTVIALMACLILFPITFTFGMQEERTVGLIFMNMPLAFSQMPGGALWGVLFFALLTFAALTSGISLLEVAASYFIDERGWTRRRAALTCGIAILLLGIPSALSGGTRLFGEQFQSLTSNLGVNDGAGFNWFDFFDYLASNWMLPLGGLFIALFVAWRVGGAAREAGFKTGTRFGGLYWGWIQLLRYVVPIAVILVFLNAIGLLGFLDGT